METTNLLPVLGLLALAIVVVILLLRFMRARHAADDRHPAVDKAAVQAKPPLSKEEQEYLDSSHIFTPGSDALDTRADAWRNNKRK